MSARNKIMLTIVATILGGLSLLLFTIITRDILFDGLSLCSSSRLELGLGSLTLFSAAVTAGFITSIIVVRKTFLPHILISVGVLAKMAFITSCFHLNSSLLFEIGINTSLILGLWLGNYSAVKFPLAPIS